MPRFNMGGTPMPLRGPGRAATPEPVEPIRHTVVIRGPAGDIELRVAPDQTILDAALQAGLELPNLCCQGWCLTCAARLVAGAVQHPHAARYFDQDAQGGFVLLCTATPLTDCTVVPNVQEAMREWRKRLGLPMPGAG